MTKSNKIRSEAATDYDVRPRLTGSLRNDELLAAHNHPSGDPRPSLDDRAITKELKDALALVDVRVLDHIVVAREGCSSLAELGMI